MPVVTISSSGYPLELIMLNGDDHRIAKGDGNFLASN
jgi:hypothetical protein